MQTMNSVLRLPISNLFNQFKFSGPFSSPVIGAYKAFNVNKNIMLCNYGRRIRLNFFFACCSQQRLYHPRSCGLHDHHKIALTSSRNNASVGLSPLFLESPWVRINMRYSSTMPHNTSSTTKQSEEGGESKARVLFRKYGYVFVGTYLSIYAFTLVTFFFGLDSGLLDPSTLAQVFKVSKNLACETADVIGPTGTGASMNEAAEAYAAGVSAEVKEDGRTLVDIVKSYMQKWEWSRGYAQRLEENPHLANLGVAWFIVKFTEPLRLAAAVIITPKAAKILGRKVPKV